MASIPTKLMSELYAKTIDNECEDTYVRSYMGHYEYPIFELYHYGTRILKYDMERGIDKVDGYSVSDRDAINSILRIVGDNDRVSNSGGFIHVAND